ncbi:MAG: 16S rRNA (uracil(1498)-N(3))-methyltransferase [Planctomycetota bacterium]|nr:16S rRNA (uracil(1498)-N(3))-methyltransferase [Planctomycetota bacterium]
MSRRPRVFHEGPLVAGSSIDLSTEEGRHLTRVLRLRPGDEVEVFDGLGGVARGEVLECEGETRVRLIRHAQAPCVPEFRLTLALCGLRPERFEWAVQKATELGVAAFRPVSSRRTERGGVRASRLERIVLEACKQCGRNRLPDLLEPETLPLARPRGAEGWVLDGGAPASLVDRLEEGSSAPEALILAIGPEGGFETEETARFVRDGWTAVRLGPRTLRAETAALAAATLVLGRWGDLGSEEGPPGRWFSGPARPS